MLKYNNSRQQLKEILKNINTMFHLTTDGWSKNNGEVIPYISLTLHFLNDNFEAVNIDLGNLFTLKLLKLCFKFKELKHYPYPHNSESIALALIEILEKFEIQDKVISITTDSAANQLSACKLLKDFIKAEGDKERSFIK